MLARFLGQGFEAAAVTAFGAVAGSAPPEARYDVTYAGMAFERRSASSPRTGPAALPSSPAG